MAAASKDSSRKTSWVNTDKISTIRRHCFISVMMGPVDVGCSVNLRGFVALRQMRHGISYVFQSHLWVNTVVHAQFLDEGRLPMVRNAAGCACCLFRPNFLFRNVGLGLRIVVADGRRKFLMFLDKIVVVRLVKNFTKPPFYYDGRKNTLHNVIPRELHILRMLKLR